jgi:hypothetical protein
MDTQHNAVTTRRRRLEVLLFLVASGVGIYGLGQSLTGLVTGLTLNLGWLAIAGLAFYVLAAQMGRVHDAWPHRPTSAPPTSTSPEPGQEVPSLPESR